MEHMRFLCFGVAMMLGGFAWGQATLHGVWVLNEGYEGLEPVTLGRFDPATMEYSVVASIEDAAFATDVLVSELGVYVATEGGVMRFHRDSGELLAMSNFAGARQLALHEGQVYVTRGEFDADAWAPVEFEAYLVWLDAETLEWEGALNTASGPGFATEGIVSVGEDVYVAVGNAFDFGNEVGRIGRFSPNSGAYEEWNLGASGRNPVHLLEQEGVLFSVNNGDWSATSLSRMDATTGEVLTAVVDASASGCMAAAVVGEKLAFQVSGEPEVRTAQLMDLAPGLPLLATSMGFYAMEEDPTTGAIYASETDWFSYGQVHIYSADGGQIGSFPTGISPVDIAMDVRTVNQIATGDMLSTGRVVRRYDAMGRLIDGEFRAAGWILECFEDGSVKKRWHDPQRD